MITYWKEEHLVQSKSDYLDKAKQIQRIIDGLLNLYESVSADEKIDSYSLDDGQTKINVSYESKEAIMGSIQKWERLKNYYESKVRGRRFKLTDQKNFRQ